MQFMLKSAMLASIPCESDRYAVTHVFISTCP